MKISILLLMIASVSMAQAQIYKCPGKVERQYTYQERPCKGAKAEEHTIKIVPTDEKKIAEAQAKLAREIDAEKNQLIKEPITEPNLESSTVNASTEKTPPVNSSEKTTASRVNPNQVMAIPAPATKPQNAVPVPAVALPQTTPIPVVATPKTTSVTSAPAVVNPALKKAITKPEGAK